MTLDGKDIVLKDRSALHMATPSSMTLYLLFHFYNPGQNSWDTNAIAHQNDAFPLPSPRRCSVDIMHFNAYAFVRGRIRVNLAKCVSQDVLTRVVTPTC